MTTEIAVANRWGIALAADSAVTIEQYHKRKLTEKVYNSANKLFTLSKFHPVGLMIYNGMTLGGTPWETIVKVIRSELKDQEFKTLEEYCEFFFSSLASHGMLFPPASSNEVVQRNMYRVLYDVLEEQIKDADAQDADIDLPAAIIEIKEAIKAIEGVQYIDGFDEYFHHSLFGQYSSEFANVLSAISKDHGNSPEFEEVSRRLIGSWFSRKVSIPGYSGIVICGFGSNDVFPKLYEYLADCIVCGKVRYWKNQEKIIDGDTASFVMPFADSEFLDTLLNGINPTFFRKFAAETFKMVMALPETLVSQIVELTDEQKEKYAELLRQSVIDPYNQLGEDLTNFRLSEYVHPIEGTLQVLPISELAGIAETFISAAQIHKRVNPLLDTVGGPVDVAVISKGDGFVWVKRKHYFESKLNPAFVQKYLES